MAYRTPFPVYPTFGGLSTPPAPDLVTLLAIVFTTFTLQFFEATAWLPALLRLTPALWQDGYLWQLVTYPFAGFGPPSLWFLLELLILYMFGNQVYWRLGRRRFWQVLLGSTATAALVATLVALAVGDHPLGFTLMQGQRTLLALCIAAFAASFGDATILLFFVLPVKARWFVWIELAVAFIAYLSTRDLAGFAGVCAAVAGGFFAAAGPSGGRRAWLSLQELRLRLALRLRRRPRLRLVHREPPKRWLH